ncbi:BamA/TamA family outer membrane protein [Gemmatimonas sp.]
MTLVASRAAAAQRSAPDSTLGRRHIQPLPAIGSAPETGLQLGITVLSVFEPPAAHRARPASVVATAIRSTAGQTRISLEGERWSHHNARRLHGLAAWQKFPLPYYGIGSRTPDESKELYVPTGLEATGTIQQRVRGAWYGLLTGRVVSQSIRPDSSTGQLATDARVIDGDGGRVVELSAGLLRDSRDFVFNPTRGTFSQITYTASATSIGSEFAYRRLRADARQYVPLGRGHTLALHGLLFGTTGSAPFDQLALVGGGDILRGYQRGRYRDRWLLASQAEYRTPVLHRLGAVAFFGAGAVANRARSLVDQPEARVLTSYGAGLRVQIDQRQRTAVRVDFGRGRDGASGLYIGFNQAY